MERQFKLNPAHVTPLTGSEYMLMPNGSVAFVKSPALPELGPHYIVITGEPIMKEHGLRPQTLTITAGECSGLLEKFKDESGRAILVLNKQATREFHKHYGLSMEGQKVVYEKQLIVNEILNIFDRFRMPTTAIDKYNEVGRGILGHKMMMSIILNQPIRFSMLGYPFKSANTRDKVLGETPDFAEQKSLENLSNFNRLVKQIYTPGVQFSVISDGYIFSDIMGLSDQTVLNYNNITKEMGKIAPIKFYDARDFYSDTDMFTIREKRRMELFTSPTM